MCITGPSGCGKTECIRTLGAAHREMGHLVKTDIVCTEAVESEELLGYVDPETRCVTEGGGGEREGGMDDCDSETLQCRFRFSKTSLVYNSSFQS